MSADQGSSKVLTLDKSETAPDAIQAPQDLQALEDLPGPQAPPASE
ncbi:MAG TPA: RNA polymerase sigma factor SigF, partial [Streptomyces sp.]|nr:RNA polymerase sigma factor SigF [Streptomyces sp.]